MLKKISLIVSIAIISSSLFASPETKTPIVNTIVNCPVSIVDFDNPNNTIPMTFTIFTHETTKGLMAIIQQADTLETSKVTVEEFTINNISTTSIEDTLNNIERDYAPVNYGEQLISHAYVMQNDLLLGQFMNSGIKDLTTIKNIKVYTIGEVTNMGSTSIIEAKDKDGNHLGTFLGGFLLAKCL